MNIVVALPAESRPLIHALGLASVHALNLPGVVHAGEGIHIIRSGVGRERAAAAVETLDHIHRSHGRDRSNPGMHWLNFGIAGHHSLPVGTLAFAQRVTDTLDGRHWMLAPPEVPGIKRSPLHSVAVAESGYLQRGLVDMEAAGFVAAASRIAPLHRIHSLKIVSDNPQRDSRRIDGPFVLGLIQERLDDIIRAIRLLAAPEGTA